MHATCCAQQCSDMLCWHVAPDRLTGALGPNRLNYRSPFQGILTLPNIVRG